MYEYENIAAFKQSQGTPLGPTDWLTVTQEMINDFANATLDHQWIHVDIERAKAESPFGGPIAHGFLTVSLASYFLEKLVLIKGARMGVNYGLNKIRFLNPVPVDSRLRLKTIVSKIEDIDNQGIKIWWDCEIEMEGASKPACVAQFISLLY